MANQELHMHRRSKIFTGDMRGVNKAARRIKRMLPDIERAGVKHFEFLFGDDGRQPFILAQNLDENDASIRLPGKLENRLRKAAKRMMPPAWHKGAAADGILSWSLERDVMRLHVSWAHEQDWPLSAEAERRLNKDDDADYDAV